MAKRGRPSKAEMIERLKKDRQIIPTVMVSSAYKKADFEEDPDAPEDEPPWVEALEGKERRVYKTNGTDPVSRPDPTTAATLTPPKEGEFSGSLRERGVQKELAAAIINVNTGTLTQWADGGGIRLTPDGFVPIPEIRRKIFEVHRGRSGVLTGSPEATTVSDAKVRAEIAKAGGEELKFAQALGEVVSRKAVIARFVDIAAMVKTRLMSIPDRLADDLVGIPDRHKIRSILSKEIVEALSGLSKPFSLRRNENTNETDDKRAGGSARKEGQTPQDA